MTVAVLRHLCEAIKVCLLSVPYNKSDMQALVEENARIVGYNGYSSDCLITVDEVRNAVQKLNAYKRDCNLS